MDNNNLLNEGLTAQNLVLTELQIEKLLQLLELLDKWNKVYNLTAVRDKNQMITRHLLDSLSTLTFLKNVNNIADLGSGGGFPGLPLAICCEDKQFTLIDSNVKKTRFLTQAKNELGLNNVSVIHERVQSVQVKVPFDCLIARAFAAPSEIVNMSSHLVANKGKLVLMMSHVDRQSLLGLTAFELKECVPVQIFNEQTERHVVIFSKSS